MSGIPTLDADQESLQTLRELWFFTLARLIAEGALTSSLAADYTAFGKKLDDAMLQETKRRDAIVVGNAKAVVADNVLNDLLGKVSAVIHKGKQPDVSLPQHQLYFGHQTPGEARRPILGSQLDLMSVWPGKLTQSSDPALQTLAPPVTTGVATGMAVRGEVTQAAADNATFRLDGQRRQVFDEYNALAASTYGALRAIVHDHPELNLRADWHDSFYRHFTRDPGPQTVGEADTEIAKLQAQMDALKAKREELVQAEKDAAAAEADAATAQQALDAATAAEDAATKARKKAEDALKKAKQKAKK